jgi:outer membrane protein assembly factor BamB
MKRIVTIFICFCTITIFLWGTDALSETDRYWHQWRGPEASGVAPDADPPIEWSENKNVRWKTAIPGQGHATPIVWDDTVFVTTAISTNKQIELEPIEEPRRRRGRRGGGSNRPSTVQKFVLFAIDRSDGTIRWQQTAREEVPHEGTHQTGSWAANSPVTDGEHVYAYFGSRGLYCYDMQGNLQWEKDLGNMSTRRGFGEGSSPVLYGDTLVINWDHEGDSFIVALDKRTGAVLWKVDRDESTSWATPIVVEHNGTPQVIINATNRTRGYDLATGKTLWECGGMTANTIPSPVTANGIVYVTSGFRGNALQAIRLADAEGDITGAAAIVWDYGRDTPYVPSPLLYGDTLYFLKHNRGVLSAFNASTGEAYYGPERLEGISDVYASPVGAGDRIYVVDRDGAALVIKHGSTFEVLAENLLDDGFNASPAIVGKEIFLRGNKSLYCIASD